MKGSITSTSISIKWSPIPVSHVNGLLLGYRLKYALALHGRTKKHISNQHREYILPVKRDRHSYVIGNLKKFTRYSVSIAGYTQQGVGPYSRDVEFRTAEDGKSFSLLSCL